ncbi:MAG: glycosyltransferase family 2 protein [Parcubacteria group bacterium]|nr:glycosyltransferase family 2 protein [Parcubacteria group bacterium]
MKLSIVIPAYNEKGTFAEIIRRVQAVDLGAVEKEIIVVDNNSSDGTYEIARSLTGVKTLREERPGKGAAVKAGFKNATGDILLIQDADLEYDPNDYAAVIKPILDGRTEAVLGVRIAPERDARRRKSLYWISWLGNKAITWTTNWLYWNDAGEYEGCYKAFTKRLVDSIEVKTDDFDYDNELVCKLLRLGYKTVDVPIRYHPRSYEEGKKIGWRHGFKILWTIVKLRFVD